MPLYIFDSYIHGSKIHQKVHSINLTIGVLKVLKLDKIRFMVVFLTGNCTLQQLTLSLRNAITDNTNNPT